MLATLLYNNCTLHTPLPYPCAYSICATRHPAHYPNNQVVATQPMTVHAHAAVPFGAHAQSQFR